MTVVRKAIENGCRGKDSCRDVKAAGGQKFPLMASLALVI